VRRLAIRVAIVLVLAAQGWAALRGTRYFRAVDAGEGYFGGAAYEDAVEEFDRARSIWDADAEVWSWLGDSVTRLLRTPPPGGWPQEREAALLAMGWYAYAGAVLRCPADSWSWSGLAQVSLYGAQARDRERGIDLAELARRGEGILDSAHAVAVAAATLALRLQPSGYQELDVLARIYESTGEVEKASKAYVQSARIMPAPSFHSWGSGRRLVPTLYAAILEGANEGIARAPAFDKSMLHLELGMFARGQGDLETALEHLRAARGAAREPFWTYHALWQLSFVLEDLGRLPEAVDLLIQARGLGYDRAQVNRRLGSLEASSGGFANACRDLRDALREIAGDTGLRIETARACLAAGDFDTAEQVLREDLGVPIENLPLARALLDLYREVGRTHSADALVREWSAEYPDQPEFRAWLEELAPRRLIVPGTGLVSMDPARPGRTRPGPSPPGRQEGAR